jgi:hypothetical protein
MKRIIIFCQMFCLMACQAKEEGEFNMNAVKLPENPETAVEALPTGKPIRVLKNDAGGAKIERKIIRNANISFQVADVANSAKRIEIAVKKFNGFVKSSEETRNGNGLRHNITVRVPALQLDTFLVALLKESIYTESKTITAEDVTKQYVDLEARIKAKKITEEKYLEILKKARNVEEVLKVEEQLGMMREDIESREAELRELKNDVAMSTVNASFYQTVEGSNAPDKPFYTKVWDSFTDGLGLLNAVFLGFFYFLPVMVVLGGMGWFLMYYSGGKSLAFRRRL